MDTVTREVCAAAGSDVVMGREGVKKISELPRASADQEAACFSQFRRTAQTIHGYFARLDLLRRKAESQMQMGRDFPKVLASALCMQNGSPLR